MALHWTWLALPGFVAAALEVAIGTLVLALSPNRRANRFLGGFLILDAALPASLALALLDEGDASLATAAATTAAASGIAALAAFFVFLSTLRTPLVAWLRPAAVRWGIVVLGLALAFLIIVPDPWFEIRFLETSENTQTVAEDPAPDATRDSAGVGGAWVLIAGLVLPLFFIAVAVDSWRRSPRGALARRQAARYVAAFVFRDVSLVVVAFSLVLFIGKAVATWGPSAIYLFIVGAMTAWVVFVLLLAYGILSASLFDIDLKVRSGIRRSTLVASFVAVFFVVTITAENFLTSTYGWAVGGVAAGLLLFALAPLQRLAELVSHAAVPPDSTTPDYLAFRKLDVYRAAVESAYEEGGVSDKERAILVRTAAKLGITPTDAQAIERDVATGDGAKSRRRMAAT